MNWIDIIILLVIAAAIFLGLRIGLIRAALSLAGLVVGVVLAGHYYIPLSKQLPFVPQAKVAEIIAFAVIVIGVMIMAGVLAKFLGWATSALMLGWVNHLGGAVLSLVLGAILCGALLAMWVKVFGATAVISKSSLAAVLLDRFPAVLALLPDEFKVIRSFFR